MSKAKPAFSEQMRAAVKNCGISQYRIAKDTGVSAGFLSRFVNGQAFGSPATLDKLADYLGISIVVEKPSPKKGKA